MIGEWEGVIELEPVHQCLEVIVDLFKGKSQSSAQYNGTMYEPHHLICFMLYIIINGSLLNYKFVTPSGYVNKFNGAIVD
jgi:hypothetical protein